MDSRLEVYLNNDKCYDIVIEDSFARLREELLKLYDTKRKLCVITDSNVSGLYAEEVKKDLLGSFETVKTFVFQAGEESKNLETVSDAYRFLIENGFNRRDVIIALGGGVTGDLSGFTAATYMRGIDFVQIPTTLLSMADSSIGGKTGVDFNAYKNMVGAFYMPKLVYINISTLSSLDARQFSSGMAEVLKAGLIKNGAFYEWLINNFNPITEREPDFLRKMIYESVRIKRDVVSQDPYEKGERALLNFGHTLGHAIEKFYDLRLSHGECVALGSCAAAFISYKRGLIEMEDYYEIRDMFVPFGLPISAEGMDKEKIAALTASDKKNDEAGLKFILLKGIGNAVIVRDVSVDEMLLALSELEYDDEK
ncbi:MAG: 3-dehydroquinate synthase [Lachnospiraceae bacterium]|nr:3-dehydroquinate synthase [Lachnospiraceae bacterium]